jgi:hypothetical protein
MRKRIDCMRKGQKGGSMKESTSSIKRKEEESNISPEKISKGPLSDWTFRQMNCRTSEPGDYQAVPLTSSWG